MKSDAETRKTVNETLEQLKGSVEVAAENGLFSLVEEDLEIKIRGEIIAAIDAVAKDDLAKAESHLFKADTCFSAAWNKAGFHWRLRTEWGLYHHLATVFSVGIAVLLLYFIDDGSTSILPRDICVVGILGATLRGLYWVQYRTNQRLLRRVWLGSFLFAAPIGAILAVVTYWAVCANLVIFSSSGNRTPNEFSTWLLCFYASFQWRWALEAIAKVSAKTK